MKKITNTSVLLISLISFFYFSFAVIQNSDWKVPAEAAAKKNPVKSDSENMAIGKSLYAKHCKSCHGKDGLGDGTKAGELDTFPGDFTTAEFQKQSDGSLFYKLSEGRDEMPAFNKKIPSDEDRWILVSFMRTLK